MFWTILRFELAYHLKRPVTYLYFAVLFLLSFFFLASDAVDLAGGVGLVRKNSPYVLTQMTIILTVIGQVITVALVGTAILRDFQVQSHELLFTTRMTRFGYLGGRFAGSFLAMALAFLGIPLGAMVGTFMPWVDADKLLAFQPWFYLQPYLLFGLTNVLLVSALFFAVGALTRSIFAIYTQGFFLLLVWSVTQQWLSGLERDGLANALDAFGASSFQLTTRYWTVAERNTELVALEGLVLTNRLIWVGVAVALAALTMVLFRFEARARPLWKKRPQAQATPRPIRTGALPAVTPAFGRAAEWRQLVSSSRFSFLRIVKDKPFVAIAAIAAINVFMNAWYADSFYGATTWPVTYLVAELMTGGFFLFMIILTTVYAGESVWRERSMKADQIADAMPVPIWAIMTGKIVGVILSQVVLLLVLFGIGILVQTAKGYFNYEPALYLRFLFGTTFPWIVAVTLFAFMVHALVNSKFLGHLVIIVYWVGTVVLQSVGFEHQLYQFGSTPGFTYSDMNGFGHYVGNLLLAAGYSMGLGLMAAVLAVLFWVRGTDEGLSRRWRIARARFTPRVAGALGACALLVLLFGGSIFYNTNVLNTYRTSDDDNELRAEWERTYKPYQDLPLPRIVDVDVTAELWPERRAYALDGRYIVVNKESVPVDTVLVSYDQALDVERMAWSRAATLAVEDTVTGMLLYVFERPLAPGDTAELAYRLSFEAEGFPNAGSNTRIVENGTFLAGVGPSLGYDPRAELAGDDERKKLGLPERERLPDLDDPAARANAQFSMDSDHIRFAATIGTAPDQIALAPGYLEREWREDGRRWFRYVMDVPIWNFATVVSARYEVKRDRWRDSVDIAVYHHPGHEYNVDRMIESVKASLDYYTEHFGPYQHRELRIVEFPRYAGFAQSFATTIPYSEGIGFIQRVKDEEKDLDMPFFVTAHEVAHQWWGHQVAGANAQGSAMMVESMAEYSALVVMEKRYGRDLAQKFLRHELDNYLSGRAGERKKEQPLIRTENQAYIHYYKGALVLYALRDYIGEDAMNRALGAYLAEHRNEEAPYSTARDFVAYLRAETPDSLQYVIEDLIETITLYDNKTSEASVTRRDDGTWAVRLVLDARKMRADSVGNETEIPLADYIDVGVFGEKEKGNALGKPLYLEKHRITGARTELEIVVDEEPKKTGIDPYNKLIDRVPSDNVKDLGRPSAEAPRRSAAGVTSPR